MIEDALEDFWKQNKMPPQSRNMNVVMIGPADRTAEYLREADNEKRSPLRRPSMYNKQEVETMYGPDGGVAEIYANGKAYIVYPDGGYQKRIFPSRPEAIRSMIKKGWVLE